MARLFEFQSKRLLKEGGVPVPRGEVAGTAEEAGKIAEKIKGPVAVKIQVWLTGRAGLGGIRFARTPAEAAEVSRRLLGMKVRNFTVDRVLIEEKLNIRAEYFAGIVIDDARKQPVLVFSPAGGTGVEEIARKHPEKVFQLPIDIRNGLRDYHVRNVLRQAGISGPKMVQISDVLTGFYAIAREKDARSAEMNPLVLTEEGKVVAADCHFVIDDYAVFRHPELGIEVAREFDRPPTALEKIAYKIEEKDHRGTFYFFQMADNVPKEEQFIGFHGAGGGGSMMSMDALLDRGFKLANYCDTSGNPPASKVYRAAKIILSQPNIKGYLASGSGVASQEQYHSARGFVKAFNEERLGIPAVIRLGGNCEEEAIAILRKYLKGIPGRVEGYGRADSPEFCARRLEELIRENESKNQRVQPEEEFTLPQDQYGFETMTGSLFIDHEKCRSCRTFGCVEACMPRILKLEDGRPVLAVSPEEAKKGKCTECLACELYCAFHEQKAITIFLPIPGLKEYRETIIGPAGKRRRKTGD